MILKRIASSAIDGDFPWDPFNLVLAVRAQAEPKPKPIVCLTEETLQEMLDLQFNKDEEDDEDGSNN
jgi:hypothetical protein